MPLSIKLVLIYLTLETLLNILYVGRHIEITGFTAVLTVVTHGLMIWAIIAAVSP